ncbi:MAG: UDP-N-acetylmuramate dehydrogenase [Bryobacterales bacterium]|nr:UDP-N-acetylmuramate dehydrogenase [Bryobacterales bacterium]
MEPFLSAAQRLDVHVEKNAPLSRLTRFGIGGPADLLLETEDESAFLELLRLAAASGIPYMVLGGGSNLIASDEGYRGAILRYRGSCISLEQTQIRTQAGAELQSLVDFSIAHGLAGLHTMTRIPGWVGAAVYGNAGAYGHSIHEFVREVRYFDGAQVRTADNAACRFTYRESVFKQRKDWIILDTLLELPLGDPAELQAQATEIQRTRDARYPPTMKCAGSIFKNLLFKNLPPSAAAEVPPKLVREGKVPSAWFLEQVGVKGLRRGDIQVAGYHANLIYNDGQGTAADLRAVIATLKEKVRVRFGFDLEEEVQYVGI